MVVGTIGALFAAEKEVLGGAIAAQFG